MRTTSTGPARPAASCCCWPCGGAGWAFHATRFEPQRPDQRLLGLTQILAVTIMAYGHVPVYMGVFSLAAGTVAMAGMEAWTAAQVMLYIAGVALIPLGLAMLRVASANHEIHSQRQSSRAMEPGHERRPGGTVQTQGRLGTPGSTSDREPDA